MLRFLNQCSQGRSAWLLMAFTALALELDGAVVPACDVTETLRALYLSTLRVIRRFRCCADRRDRPENSAALCSDGYLVV